jgi:hypothetical protein
LLICIPPASWYSFIGDINIVVNIKGLHIYP